jgi:hypothetical protein
MWICAFPVILFIALVCHDRAPSDPAVANVSGYYGPGSYLAWYITAVSAMYPHEVLVYARFLELRGAEQRHPCQNHLLSGATIATIAYPAVAIVDLAIRSLRMDLGPSADAAQCVTCASWWLSAACITSECIKWRSTGRLNWTTRTVAWVSLLLASSFSLVITRCVLRPNTLVVGPIVNQWTTLLVSLYILISLNTLAKEVDKKNSHQPMRTILLWTIPAPIGFAAFSISLKFPSPDNSHIMFIPFPVTAAKLSDLDQAAAVGTALVAVCITLVLGYTNSHTERETASDDSEELQPILGTRVKLGDEIPPSLNAGSSRLSYGAV